jgi:hypothetical protein
MCGVLVGSYALCMARVCIVCSVVRGCVVFLVGVGGILVVFLYTASLCGGSMASRRAVIRFGYLALVVLLRGGVLMVRYDFESVRLCEMDSYGAEGLLMGGLTDLLPWVGALLFLCVVGVIYICRTTIGCIGGPRVLGSCRKMLY